MLIDFQGVSGFIRQTETGLLVTQNAHEDFQEADEHHGVAEGHDHADMPLLHAVVAEVFGADTGLEQGVYPVVAADRDEAGVARVSAELHE